MKISIMTLNMFGPMYFKYNVDHDREDLLETYEEMLQMISETGYTAVDVTSWEAQSLELETLKQLLDKYQLKVASYIYMAPFAAMDEEGFENRVEEAKKGVDAAKYLGTEVLMLVPQGLKDAADYTPQRIRSQMVKHWIPVTKYAVENGIHPVVEDTPDLGLHFCRAVDVKEVLDQIPGLEVVFDTGNALFVDEDPCEYYEQFAEKTSHIHLKDIHPADAGAMLFETMQDGTNVTACILGEGLVDMDKFIACAKKHDYKGYLTVEFSCGFDGDYRKSLIYDREYVEARIK